MNPVNEKVALAAKLLLDAAGPAARVILFGSHAREEAQAGGEIDFVIIEPEVADRHAEMITLRRALRGIRRPVDLLVYSQADVERW